MIPLKRTTSPGKYAFLIVLGTASSGVLYAQASLPATAPTSVTVSQLPSANPPVAQGSAEIHWDGHLLQLTGTGQSLREVFYAIGSRTGLRISGTAPDDRIYGTYGPAPLVDVLSELVRGLSVNMLFVEHIGSRPAELTFSARSGAATPASAMPTQAYGQGQPQPSPDVSATAGQFPNAATVPPGSGGPGAGVGAGTQTSDASGSPTSPNGVKTPQEIFEQLQRLRARAGTAPQQ